MGSQEPSNNLSAHKHHEIGSKHEEKGLWNRIYFPFSYVSLSNDNPYVFPVFVLFCILP